MALARELAKLPGDRGSRALAEMLGSFSVEEKAALAARWDFWARPKQLAPEGPWKTWGFLSGRGFGKTRSLSEYIIGRAFAGEANLIGVCAQDEASAVDIQIKGPSGLLTLSPPWFKPHWIASALQLVWPNGATAYVRTPEVPGKIRGLEYHLFWASELQSWPVVTRDEAFSNVRLSTRLGMARIVWDATPKRRHPVLKELLADSLAVPELHKVTRGSTYENAINLGDGYVEELARKLEGTKRGLEELYGEMLEDSDGALFKPAWIGPHRAARPDKFACKCISIDPAISSRAGSDNTGIVVAGLGTDGRAYVLRDKSGKYEMQRWIEIVIELYEQEGCNFIVAERNKGGEAIAAMLRVVGQTLGKRVIMIERGERPPKIPHVLYIMEVYAQGTKADRAEPVAAAYERGRVSHVGKEGFETLEETMTTWEPTGNDTSPGDLDALVHGITELLGLKEQPKPRVERVRGAVDAAKRLHLSEPSRLLDRFEGSGRGRI